MVMVGLSVSEARIVLEGVDRLQSIDFVSQNQIQVACRIMDKFPELEREYSYLKDRYNQSLYKKMMDSEMLEDGDCGSAAVNDVLSKHCTFTPWEFPAGDCQHLVLQQAMECGVWGVNGKEVIVLGRLGRLTFSVAASSTGQVLVTYIPHRMGPPGDLGDWFGRCIQFWTSVTMLSDLGKKLRGRVGMKVPYEKIFRGEYGGLELTEAFSQVPDLITVEDPES